MFIKYNLPAIIWAIFILIICTIHLPEISPPSKVLFIPTDKLVHFFLFLILIILLVRGFSKQNSFIKLKLNAIRAGLIFSVIYGGIIEMIQIYTDYRQAEWNDFIADITGSCAGLGIIYLIKWIY